MSSGRGKSFELILASGAGASVQEYVCKRVKVLVQELKLGLTKDFMGEARGGEGRAEISRVGHRGRRANKIGGNAV